MGFAAVIVEPKSLRKGSKGELVGLVHDRLQLFANAGVSDPDCVEGDAVVSPLGDQKMENVRERLHLVQIDSDAELNHGTGIQSELADVNLKHASLSLNKCLHFSWNQCGIVHPQRYGVILKDVDLPKVNGCRFFPSVGSRASNNLEGTQENQQLKHDEMVERSKGRTVEKRVGIGEAESQYSPGM